MHSKQAISLGAAIGFTLRARAFATDEAAADCRIDPAPAPDSPALVAATVTGYADPGEVARITSAVELPTGAPESLAYLSLPRV
jgi:hypothetical protein